MRSLWDASTAKSDSMRRATPLDNIIESEQQFNNCPTLFFICFKSLRDIKILFVRVKFGDFM